MSPPPYTVIRQPQDLNMQSSPTSSDGEPTLESTAPPSPTPKPPTTDRGNRSAFSQSTPASADYTGWANQNVVTEGGSSSMVHPPRTHSQGALLPSNFMVRPPEAYSGQTWVDFLRETGAENANVPPSRAFNRQGEFQPHGVPPSRFHLPARPSRSSGTASTHSSTERKRRLTTPESPMRRHSSFRLQSSDMGANLSDPTVLTSSSSIPPPRPPLLARTSRSSHHSTSSHRRESDIMLPPWQPDSDVTHCYVCENQFSFFFRKHHCRKCGRVVCATCSPHRITIPRQFIVQPPDAGASANFIDLTGDDDTNAMSNYGPLGNPALGGGEEVRVCNPCVPDPNYSPPPQLPSVPLSHPYMRPSLPPAPASVDHRSNMPARIVNDIPTQPPYQWTRYSPDEDSQRRMHQGQAITYYENRRAHGHRPRISTGNMGMFHPAPSESALNLPAPRRIAEEDECPICGNELPPKGPLDDESTREEHINSCILNYAQGSTSPAQHSSTSLPNPRTRGMSNHGGSNRISISARGMFPYVATEKDCVDEDGSPIECVICLVEFEAGDKLARLVCMCKFHEDCIQGWWATKGRGACPTHQLHE